jgi:release factor glutamine methyltransferase
MRLFTLPGVFRPISDSWQLAGAACSLAPTGARVLEIGTGSGAIAVSLARCGADVVAVDVSRRALASAALNARMHGTRIETRRGSLFDPVAGERFDLIVSNPPYVPCPRADLPTRGPERAWDAGVDGRAVLDVLIEAAPAHLRPDGSLLICHSTINGEVETFAAMRRAGLEPEVVARHPGPLGPLMRERVDHLEAQGLITPGRRDEEVLIVRGRLSAASRSRRRDPRSTRHPSPSPTG